MNKDKQNNLKEDILYSELYRALYDCKLYGYNMSLVIWNENEKNKISFQKTNFSFINFCKHI
jgi:hypothetical protein